MTPASDDPETRRLAELLLRLCQIPSITGEERALCDTLEADLSRAHLYHDGAASGPILRRAGARLAAPVRRYKNSLVVPVTRGTGGPRIALVGHLDVVPTSHDAPPRIEGDRLYGPGAADMKSGLALMLDLITSSPSDYQRVDLTLVFYAREEGPYLDNELGPVLDADPDLSHVDLAVCMEPSDNKLSLGASGSLHAAVTFEGRTAHSARPWQGENAIHKAGPVLAELDQLTPRETTVDGLVYRTVTSVTLASGGRGRNVIPDSFTLNLNHRFAPGTSLEQAQADVLALVAGRASVTFKDLSPSALPHASHPLVVALREAGVAAVEPKQAWTDVARFASIGVPAVNFGPGDNAQAHQRNEWTTISKLGEGMRILRAWLRTIGERAR
jgi:succinyl-diaminopimelate desuccinylase